MNKKENLEVFGALIQGYALACVNLNIIAGRLLVEEINQLVINQWYPLTHWTRLESTVIQSYEDSDPIMLRVGMEMMSAWYKFGPGRNIVKTGIDFLRFQTGSQGYVSVVRGDKELIGNFTLKYLDEKAGKAIVHTTTPFNRMMECGVLLGGMLAPGDLDYVDVTNQKDKDYLEIEFH